ncbi:MAG: hypothetical protein J0L72_08270, partial [Armatimonadetes bacterium]|nr:hypothetical protein [Armatimonadota bacterium]
MDRAKSLAWLIGLTGVALVATGNPSLLGTDGAAGTQVLAGLSLNVASSFVERVFRKNKSAKDWLINGHMAHLIILTLSALIETYSTDKNDKRFSVAAKKLRDLHPRFLATLAEDVDSINTDELPRHVNKSSVSIRNEPCGEVVQWIELLKYIFTEFEGGQATQVLNEDELVRLAEYIRKNYLNSLLDVAAEKPEFAHKLLFKMIGTGFEAQAKELESISKAIEERQQPLFTIPEDPGANRFFDFAHEYVSFRGRDEEIKRVGAFLKGKPGLSWWRIAGPGGAGKSRFALHLVHLARLEGWVSGFVGQLTDDTYQDFAKWTPAHDTFLIFDYAVDKPELTRRFLNYLALSEEKFKRAGVRVRVLLLAREATSLRWSMVLNSEAMRTLEPKLYQEPGHEEDGVFNSSKLDLSGTILVLPEMSNQELLWISLECWQKRFENEEFPLEEAELMIENLRKLGLTNLPLYVLFATIGLHEGRTAYKGKEELTEIMVRRQFDSWANANLTPQEYNLAMYASVVGKATRQQALEAAHELGFNDLFPTSISNPNLASLNSLQEDVTAPVGQEVFGLSPDVIAEWMVLSRLRDVMRPMLTDRALTDAENIWKVAQANPNFDAFLYRVWESFGDLTKDTAIERDLSDAQRLIQLAVILEIESEAGQEISDSQLKMLSACLHNCQDQDAVLIGASVTVNVVGRANFSTSKLIVILDNLKEHESNPEMQLVYAKGLFNAIHEKRSTMEEIQNHLESLKNLKERESNPELQLQFAMGLVNAIHEKRSTMEEIQNHLESLRNLKERESNPELQLQFAMGLVNAIHEKRSTMEEIQNHLESLRNLKERE